MERFSELLEPVVFRVEPTGAIAPLNKAATTLLGERPRDATSLFALFGKGSYADLSLAATAGQTTTTAIVQGGTATRIKWELLAPSGGGGDVLVVGVDWKPAGEFVEQMTKETLIFKELVMNIAPRFIVDAMMERKAVQPKAYRESTIVFVDAIGFAELASELDPVGLIRRLDHYFSMFDRAGSTFGLEKLKTIGDAYMAVSGIPHRKPSHAVDAALAALEILRVIEHSTGGSQLGPALDFKVALHSGPCISGVLGSSKYMFDIWGDAVNVAGEVEAAGEAGRVTASGATVDLTRDFFVVTPRAAIQFRGAEIPLFVVERLKPEYSDDGVTPNAAFRARYREMFFDEGSPLSIGPPRFMDG